MRILCERHVPPKYISALRSEPWIEVALASAYFHPEAADEEIAKYAVANEWVVFTRDRDFFDLARSLGCGVLYLDMRRDPFPGMVVQVLERINDAHADQSEIAESIPGGWTSSGGA